MKYGPENSVLTNEGDMDKFIGTEITQLDEKIFKISQHYLINKNISFLGTNNNDYGTKKMLSQRQLAIFFSQILIWKSTQRKLESQNRSWYVNLFARQYFSRNVHESASNCPIMQQSYAIPRESYQSNRAISAPYQKIRYSLQLRNF